MRISVVTPSYNQGLYIAEMLESVRVAAERAPGVEVEHLVIDGGSTDGTLDALKSQTFASWISEPDKGQADAINKGLAEATGSILAYLCADDLYEPDAIRLVTETFQSKPEIDLVYGDFYFLEGDSGWKRRRVAGPYTRDRFRNGNFLSQPATFWRQRVYERFGAFDPDLRYCMDHEYWLRIHEDTRWHYLPEPLAVARLHSHAKSSSQLVEAWAETSVMAARYGLGVPFRRKAIWMKLAGARLYRLRRRLYSFIGTWKNPAR